MPRTQLAFTMACVAALALILGCGKELSLSRSLNTPPEVRFDAPSTPMVADADIVHRVSWTGRDPDGRIAGYLVAVNPRSFDLTDPGWQSTTDHTRALRLRRATPLAGGFRANLGDEPTVIAVRAKDNLGAVSEPVVRAFFGDNVAPSVQITNPLPSSLLLYVLPTTVRIEWAGVDPDGLTGRPVKYKFKLLGEGDPEFDIDLARTSPDSLLRFYAPTFAGWDSLPAESTFITYRNLIPWQSVPLRCHRYRRSW